jgi:hypothetical protein
MPIAPEKLYPNTQFGSPEEIKKKLEFEGTFLKEIKETEWFKEFVKEYGEEPDLDTKDYDYRTAWAAGIRPERDPYDNNRYHWPSSLQDGQMLKAEDHPTAWKELYMRETGINPDAVGATKADWEDLQTRKKAPTR